MWKNFRFVLKKKLYKYAIIRSRILLVYNIFNYRAHKI